MEEWGEVKHEELDSVTTSYGTYAFVINQVIVYIGRSKCLWQRLRRHKLLKHLQEMGEDVCVRVSIEYSDYLGEKELILKHKPRYNIDYISKW